ncbi:MAG TPA: hypothetical protein VFH16_08320 [Rubrobacter sp.]|nr:hypothetical protein [Rubrobacter sp.]
MELKYVVACDFGQTYDYSTVAVTERVLEEVGKPYEHTTRAVAGSRRREVRQDLEGHYRLVRLDRVPLRTPYTTIAKGIVKLVRELYRKQLEEAPAVPAIPYPRDGGRQITVGLSIDEGGVGKAVRDILLQEMIGNIPKNEPKVKFYPVTVHGGANTSRDNGFWHVPKRDLISAGLVCYQNKTLKVGALKWRDVLEQELVNYRLKVNISTSNVAFESLRSGQHDDLLFAVCLACWTWEQALPKRKYTTL